MFSKPVWFFLVAVFVGVTGFTVASNAVSRQQLRQLPDLIIVHPTPTITKPPTSFTLPASTWVPQTFNNCGPAAVSMLLQPFGYAVDQNQTKEALRTSANDTNVFMTEIKEYLKTTYDIRAKIFYNGDKETLKLLLTNGFYVLVENWLRPNEDIGHFVIIRGYDDARGVWIADDSYFGTGMAYPYEQFEKTQWNQVNYEYMPVYAQDKEPLLRAIIGANWDQTTMYQRAIKRNEAIVQTDPNGMNAMNAWFNIGTSAFALGDMQTAKAAFETSRTLGWPARMLWYQIQPVQTYNKVGEFANALTLAKIGLRQNTEFTELLVEEAIAYKGLGDRKNAMRALREAMASAPHSTFLVELSKTF